MRQGAAAISQFDQRVAQLTAERGESVGIEEVADIVAALMHSLNGDLSATQLRLSQELTALVDYINQARAEMASLQPEEIRDHHIPQATDELDAVVQATATATSAILDAAEDMEKLAAVLPPKTAEQATAIATKIYEASNFQDLTGQRISKVMGTMKFIEQHINAMMEIWGGVDAIKSHVVPQVDTRSEDDKLLNGPKLAGDVGHASQDDIDALFD